jgi:hypothetical protein
MARNTAIFLIGLFSLTACGGISPTNARQIEVYMQQIDNQTNTGMDLASQNRMELQRNTPFVYVYTSPQIAERKTSESLPSNKTGSGNDKKIVDSKAAIAVSETITDLNETTSEAPQLPQAPAFTLENLKGENKLFAFPREKVLILAIADQKGSETMENWIKPLFDRYRDKIEIQGVAELSAVPKFARGIARGIISGLVKQPILLDWTGTVSTQFGAKPGKTNLYAINTQGQIIAQASGVANLEKLTAIVEIIDPIL